MKISYHFIQDFVYHFYCLDFLDFSYFMEFVNDESPHELQPESEGEGGQPLEGEVTGGG